MAEFSAMMRQYMKVKEAHRDALIFFRLGDFYELFFDDARLASQKLGLTLTSRDTGRGKSPMCGVPHHAAEPYIMRLVNMGYRVALCEQVGEAKKGELVPREVVRIYTSGTVVDDTKRGASYIAAVFQAKGKEAFGLAYCDVATGDFLTTHFSETCKLLDELHKIAPVEIVVNPDFKHGDEVKQSVGAASAEYHSWAFFPDIAKEKLISHFGVHNLEGFGLGDEASLCACGALLQYLNEMQSEAAAHIVTISPYAVTNFMSLDKNVRRNLELTETLRDKETEGTLLWALDQTQTAMGGRLLRKWLEGPLLDIKDIICRQQAVQEYVEQAALREEIRERLDKIADMERLSAKINYRRITPQDLMLLGQSIEAIAAVKGLLSGFESKLNSYFANALDDLGDVQDKINRALLGRDEDCMIAQGYDENLDWLRALKAGHLEALEALEAREKQASGIRGLKIGRNKVYGYYIEVSNAHKGAVPAHFIRRQTLTGSERYTTEELRRFEDEILNLTEEIDNREAELFKALRTAIVREIPRMQLTAHMVASVDVLQSLGQVAAKYNYVCPEMMDLGIIEIEGGRHPVVERLLEHQHSFVANDAYLDNFDNKIAIITGPNMAGKSTYLRQVALICIMAQMGGFVPAKSARLPICDRVFTRVGASDDLAKGQSTFMVEMNEVAGILNNATQHSLIILDEIGRGTGTADGFAIALAIVEYIATKISAKTLFATHFHELTVAEGKIEGVVNYCMQVKEDGDSISFLRKIKRGGADKSYGIAVAKLAGLPGAVIDRSAQIQEKLKIRGVFHDEELARGEAMLKQRIRLFLEDRQEELSTAEMRAWEELWP